MNNDKPLFDRMPKPIQIGFLALIILTAPVWGVLYLLHLAWESLKKDNQRALSQERRICEILQEAEKIQANQEFQRKYFRKMRAEMAYKKCQENLEKIKNREETV